MKQARERLLVQVCYAFRDGWHVFTSKNLPGLYIASEDAEAAFNDVPNAITKLIKLDTGVDAEVARAHLSYEDFSRSFMADDDEAAPAMPHPSIIESRTYTVSA